MNEPINNEESNVSTPNNTANVSTVKPSWRLTPEQRARAEADLDSLIPQMIDAMAKENEELG